MTTLLQQVFDAASRLALEEQDELAARLLAELAAGEAFYRAPAMSGDKLAILAVEALEQHRTGQKR